MRPECIQGTSEAWGCEELGMLHRHCGLWIAGRARSVDTARVPRRCLGTILPWANLHHVLLRSVTECGAAHRGVKSSTLTEPEIPCGAGDADRNQATAIIRRLAPVLHLQHEFGGTLQ